MLYTSSHAYCRFCASAGVSQPSVDTTVQSPLQFCAMAGDLVGRPYKACPLLGHAPALFLPHPPAPSPKHQGRGAKLGGFRSNLLPYTRIVSHCVLFRYCSRLLYVRFVVADKPYTVRRNSIWNLRGSYVTISATLSSSKGHAAWTVSVDPRFHPIKQRAVKIVAIAQAHELALRLC